MSVSIVWESADGEVVKGLTDCPTPSADVKLMVDRDLNHGLVRPGAVSTPQTVALRTFSWTRNGDPTYAVTNAGLWLDAYYATGPVYAADAGKAFSGGSTTVSFGGYSESGGSRSAASDLATLLAWGDEGAGVQVYLDRQKTWTPFSSAAGKSASTAIVLPKSAMDVGVVDGQLEPGDRALIHLRVSVPADCADPGVYLFTVGCKFDFTE